MKSERLKKEVSKHAEVVFNGKQYFATNLGHEMSWYDQDGSVICLKVRRLGDKDDWQSDYSAGCFYKTIKRAINAFKGE